jgi:hypothetical protein
MPDMLLSSIQQPTSGLPEDSFWISSIIPFFRLIGYFNRLVGALGSFLLWRYHVSRQRCLGYTVVILCIFAYIGTIVFDNTAGTIGAFEIAELIVFAAMILSALALRKQF